MGKRFVMAEDFKGSWPFPMEDGVLSCDRYAVTLEVGGVIYALNSPALRLAPSRGWVDPKEAEVWRESTDPLWKATVDEFATLEDGSVDFEAIGGMLRESVGPLILAGLKLCDDSL